MLYQPLLDLGFKLTEYNLYNDFKVYEFTNDEKEKIEVTYSMKLQSTRYAFTNYVEVESVVLKVLVDIEWDKVEL